MNKENATLIFMPFICLLINGCQNFQISKDKPIVLTERTQEFLRTAEGELGSFQFGIVYSADKRRGIEFGSFPWIAGRMFENQVVIDEHQVKLILQYFARSGFLDAAEPHSQANRLGGWNAYLGTRSVGAFWPLGSEPDAPLKNDELMGLRSALQDGTLEAWDRFLKRLNEPSASNNARSLR